MMVAIKLIFVCMPKRATKDGKISNYKFLKLQSYNNLKYCSLKIQIIRHLYFLLKSCIDSFQVINLSCLNKLFEKKCIQYSRSIFPN